VKTKLIEGAADDRIGLERAVAKLLWTCSMFLITEKDFHGRLLLLLDKVYDRFAKYRV
jgi:hypothetical protein